MKSNERRTWLILGTIVLCTVAGWTGFAEATWCGHSLSCIAYIPAAMFGGSLFFMPAIVVAAGLVLATTMVLKVRISPLVVLILVILMAVFGFLAGDLLPGKGQGP
jgi:hypothetical protein